MYMFSLELNFKKCLIGLSGPSGKLAGGVGLIRSKDVEMLGTLGDILIFRQKLYG